MILKHATRFARSPYFRGDQYYSALEFQHTKHQVLCRCHHPRPLSSSKRSNIEQPNLENYSNSLPEESSRTTRKLRWYLLFLGLGVSLYGLARVKRNQQRALNGPEHDFGDLPSSLHARNLDNKISGLGSEKREKLRPSGPWQVQIMSTLPLKVISRIWGRFNELELPRFLRIPGFKLYSYIFGVNLSEISESDLRAYPNLASFFYRTLKPDVRPLDPNQNALLSPADGRVLQFGSIVRGEVEQVKGITYSLDALLGSSSMPDVSTEPARSTSSLPPDLKDQKIEAAATNSDYDVIKQDEEFAVVNGISYTLSKLFSGPKKQPKTNPEDASTVPKTASEAEVKADLARGAKPWYSKLTSQNQTSLYYVVVYLAPGDYHRFHSPCAWVVKSRRHFAGELFSVSPYLQRTLPGLFTLNERVVLLGRWRWGFFSFVPVGATNVGSIKINFDRELRTNSLTTDTAADRAAEEAAKRNEPYCGFSEASYEAANPHLHGYSLRRGEEMGGFQLGSTIVLVFEAPKGKRPSLDEGWMGEKTKRKGGWNWAIERGQKIRVGEALGWVDEA